MSSPALELSGVAFAHPGGRPLFRGLDLAIEPEERVALVGESGAGKSTLLALAAGILLADAGRVSFEGEDWRGAGEGARRRRRARRIGLVFQELELLDYLRVRENVLLPFLAAGAPADPGSAERRVVDLARRTGIEPLLGRRPADLSQGERQRVALCRALVARPALVLADEPTGNLDRRTARRALDLLLEEARAAGAALVVVTHDEASLGRFDRVVDVGRLGEPAP